MDEFKVIFVGATNVGKSSMINVLNTGEVLYNPDPTTNSSVFSREYNSNGYQFVINYWDTAGQDKFKSVRSFYFRGACYAIAVFDITDNDSFDEMKEYINNFQSVSAPEFCHNIIVVANKSDLIKTENQNQNNIAMYRNWCSEQNYPFIETSAVTKYGIKELEQLAFNKMAEMAQEPQAEKSSIHRLDSVVLLDESETTPKKNCC